MKRAFVVLLLVLLGTATALSQQAPAAKEEPKPAATAAGGGDLENLFVETGAGVMMPDGEDPTSLYYAAINYGLAASPEWGVGAQIGGKGTLRNDDPDWLAQAGLFQRNLDFGMGKGAWSLQGVSQNTWMHADLISLKPTVGVELDKTNYLALTGLWGLNDETVKRSGGKVVQQPVDTAMLLWGATWMDSIRTEVGGGYEFQDVDTTILGLHAGYAFDKMTSLNLTGAADFRGNYYVALALGFDLGDNGRNATFNNITTEGGNDYTPFPLGSLPIMFYETQIEEAPAPVVIPEPE